MHLTLASDGSLVSTPLYVGFHMKPQPPAPCKTDAEHQWRRETKPDLRPDADGTDYKIMVREGCDKCGYIRFRLYKTMEEANAQSSTGGTA